MTRPSEGGLNGPRWYPSIGTWRAWCSLCGWVGETGDEDGCERMTRRHEEGRRHQRMSEPRAS